MKIEENWKKAGEYIACVILILTVWAMADIVFENYKLRKLHIAHQENNSLLKENIDMQERIIFLLENKIKRLEEGKSV